MGDRCKEQGQDLICCSLFITFAHIFIILIPKAGVIAFKKDQIMEKPIYYPQRIFISALVALGMLFTIPAQAQNELQYVGELGLSVGGAQYFGDLNTRSALNTIKP